MTGEIKPTKVPLASKEVSLETYLKQVEILEQINVDAPDNTKYQYFVQSLKVENT